MSVRKIFLFPAGLAAVGIAVAGLAGAGAPATQQATPAEIERHIGQLGSKQFRVREEASQALLKIGAIALPLLEKARRSADAETSRRATALFEQIRSGLEEQAAQRLIAKVAPGSIDQLVEQLALKKKGLAEVDWIAMLELAKIVAKKGKAQNLRMHPSFSNFMGFHVATVDEAKEHYYTFGKRLQAKAVSADVHIGSCFIICSGGVNGGLGVVNSVVFANGPVKVAGMVANSVVFANGGVTVQAQIVNSIIICDGDVRVIDGHVVNSVICARGTITTGSFFKDSVIEQHAKNPLGLLTFFDPRQLGVKVETVKGELVVKRVQAKTAFAQAGLRAGDVITTLGKKSPGSYEEFRKSLRRKVAEGRASLSVRRGEKTLEIAVTFAK